jgi:hypothetical protein
MKRSDALTPLSRDHHAALKVALRLRRAEADSAGAAAAAYVDFMRERGERHFAEEERELLPVAPADLAERTRREHGELRAYAAEFAGGAAGVEAVRAAGEALNAHVRFEERELFEILEESLSPEELAALGERLAHG